MSLSYSQWIGLLGGYLPEQIINSSQANPFVGGSRYNIALYPCIQYAEGRIYRDPDLNFLGTYLADGTSYAACTPGTRALAIPNDMVIVESCNLITPAGSAPNDIGSTRTPLLPASVAFINNAWPSQALQQAPEHWARTDQTNIVLGATPDQAYNVEFYGTAMPAMLTAQNPQTFLTTWLPDLFVAATMIFMSAYQKTFGAMSGDPMQGVTWEQYYGELKKGAAVQELRKRGVLPPNAEPPSPAPPAG